MLRNWAGKGQLKSGSVGEIDLSSNIVRDFEVTANAIIINYPSLLTTHGKAYVIGPFNSPSKIAFLKIKDRESAYLISSNAPYIVEQKVTLKGAKVSGNAFIPQCEVKSKWFDYSRSITSSKESITVLDSIVVKAQFIRNADLKSERFIEIQTKLKPCAQDIAVILNPKK